MFFDKAYQNGGEKNGSGSSVDIHAAGKNTIVRVPTPVEDNDALSVNLKEFSVTQLLREIFKEQPEILNKINLVDSLTINRRRDNGRYYKDSGPSSIVTMPRMDTDLESYAEQKR